VDGHSAAHPVGGSSVTNWRSKGLSLDNVLELAGLCGEFIALALAIRGKLLRVTPVFCSFLAWCLLNDALFFVLLRYLASFRQHYIQIYLYEMVVDSAFEFAVLVELGWAVLRPIRSSLPRHSLLMLASILIVAFVVILPVSAQMLPGGGLSKLGILFVHVQQTIAVLRVVIFLALTVFSQLLSIGWRTRELQIATGLGFYSLCNLGIMIIHTHQSVHAHQYTFLDQIGVVAYICSVAYWIVCFSQPEQERQEFTPEMRRVMVAITGGNIAE
jgi:hypothetical protein